MCGSDNGNVVSQVFIVGGLPASHWFTEKRMMQQLAYGPRIVIALPSRMTL